jgi:hypothetical protein
VEGGKDAAGKNVTYVKGPTGRALLYSLSVFFGKPSFDVATRCMPEKAKRDSKDVRGRAGASPV